jgi:2-phosphosulfolactate phosphatase
MPNIEVCVSPLLYTARTINKPYILVVIDILRATTTICTALQQGVKEIVPVDKSEEARDYKQKGFLVAGERDGLVLDFADVGNSPASFLNRKYKGQTLVLTTTNGTVVLAQSTDASAIVIGSFSNISSLVSWLKVKGSKGNNILMLCSGWYNQLSLEDSLFAGCLSSKLIDNEIYTTNCDAAMACMDLWDIARKDPFAYIQKASHMNRLKGLKVTHDLEYCFTFDTATVVPVVDQGVIRVLEG